LFSVEITLSIDVFPSAILNVLSSDVLNTFYIAQAYVKLNKHAKTFALNKKRILFALLLDLDSQPELKNDKIFMSDLHCKFKQ